MKIYTVHVRRHGLDPDRDLELVPEGFSGWAFIFSALWLLYHRLWLAAVIVIAVYVAIGGVVFWFGANEPAVLIADIVVAIVLGMVGNDIRRAKLEHAGFVEEGIATGRNRDEAEQRYLDDNPGLAAAMAGAAT